METQEQATTRLNIYEKIQAVANDIKGIEKDMQVSAGVSGSYKAVSDKAVILKIKAAEAKHKLLSIPSGQELIKIEIIQSPPDQYGKVKITYVDIVKTTVDIVDVEDTTSRITVESFGRGIDNGDKGFGKAMTYARKYALLNVYKIATGVDPDQEASKSIEVAYTPDIIRLKVENYLLSNDVARQNMFSHFNVAQMGEFTADQFRLMHDNLAKKGLLNG